MRWRRSPKETFEVRPEEARRVRERERERPNEETKIKKTEDTDWMLSTLKFIPKSFFTNSFREHLTVRKCIALSFNRFDLRKKKKTKKET